MDSTFYQELLNSLTDGVYFMDMNRTVTYWNKAAERLSGYAAEEVLGNSCGDNLLRHVDENGKHLCAQGCPMTATIVDGKVREASVFMHHKYGHRVPVFVRSSPMRDEFGKIIGAVEVFSDNGKNLNILEEMEGLRQETLTDPLTGVGNRRYANICMERLDRAMAESNVPFGALFVDIDHFKNINDTWGHDVGDMVLTMVAKTLGAVLRPLDTVCRWGGEEFVILLSNVTKEGMNVVTERVRMLVEQSWVEHESRRIAVTVSIGGAFSKSKEQAESVVKRADRQTYLSKDDGRNCGFIDDNRVVT